MRRPLVLLVALPALAVALALALATRAAAAPSTAYFRVSLTAAQDLSWSERATYRLCDGGTVDYAGAGHARLRVRTAESQIAVATRRGGHHPPTLLFSAGKANVPVVGTVTRDGERHPTAVRPAKPGACGDPLPPVAPDCGAKAYPAGTTLGVEYFEPSEWPFSGPTPLVASIVLVGPARASFTAEPMFESCPGVGGDDLLRANPEPEPEPAHSGPGSLPVAELFGHRRRFTVSGHSHATADNPLAAAVSGSRPTATTTRWTLTFRRLARRPHAP